MTELTITQQKALYKIREFLMDNDVNPTVSEVIELLGMSRGYCQAMIKSLEKAGRIEKYKGRIRNPKGTRYPEM